MKTKAIKVIMFIGVMSFPTMVFAASGNGQQNDHKHEMQGNMMPKMMDQDMMQSMMADMEKNIVKMVEIAQKMDDGAHKEALMKLHQDMTKSMQKMKMMHENMKHKMREPNSEKEEHNH